ncbi:MAG: transcription elongation factor subunit Spt4 [Candidatus Bathyarchaeia archaeon]
MTSKACRTCKVITEGNVCPICRNTDLSDDYSGLIIILNPGGSQLAQKMEITKEGRYALKVR